MPCPPGGNLRLQVRGSAAPESAGRRDGWLRFKIQPAEAWCFDSRIERQHHASNCPTIADAGQ
jgi:hypothetical protein